MMTQQGHPDGWNTKKGSWYEGMVRYNGTILQWLRSYFPEKEAAYYSSEGSSCNKTCQGDADCDQGSGCMQCDWEKVPPGHPRTKKVCQSVSESCGGAPAPACKAESKLFQHLSIGDSITDGTFPFLKTDLHGVAASFLIGRNGGPTGEGVKCIKTWIDDPTRWDIITYNFGAWDTARQPGMKTGGTPLPQYIENLRNITAALKETRAYSLGRVVYVLTTPSDNRHDNATSCCPSKQHLYPGTLGTLSCPTVIKAYNDAAVAMLQEEFPKVQIDNLFAWVNLHCCGSEDCFYKSCDFQPRAGRPLSCNVHFNGLDKDGHTGWEYLARNVSGTIKTLLHERKEGRETVV